MSSPGATLAARRIERVSSGATVRHVDQLAPAARAGVRELIAGERRTVEGLSPGEVIVATEYVRIVAVSEPDPVDASAPASAPA